MSHAGHPVDDGLVEVFVGVVAGILLGIGTFPLVALLSPLCLLTGSAAACGTLSKGPFLFLEAVGIPLGTALYSVVAVGATVCSALH